MKHCDKLWPQRLLKLSYWGVVPPMRHSPNAPQPQSATELRATCGPSAISQFRTRDRHPPRLRGAAIVASPSCNTSFIGCLG